MAEKSAPDASKFHTTRWTRVMAARGRSTTAQTALSELCKIYYEPVRSFIGRAWPREDADDLAHSFFARLLERSGLDHLEPGRGMFRSYLRGAVKHFIRDHRARESAAKRGGQAGHISLDDEESTIEPAISAPDDACFDRDWALNLIGRALETVKARQSSPRQFEMLKPWLTGETENISQSSVAAELGISPGAVKVAIHRLRKQVRLAVECEISETVSSADEVVAELDYLIQVLGRNEQAG